MKTITTVLGLLVLTTVSASAQTPAQIEGLILSGQVEPATQALDAYAASQPDEAELRFLQARLAVATGAAAEGVEELRELLAETPDNARLQAALGTSLVRYAETLPFMQRPPIYGEVIGCYRQAVALDRDCFEAQIGLAHYYLQAPEIAGGSLVLAERHAREAARLNPGYANGVLAQILLRAHKHEEAEGLFRALVEATPEDASAHLGLAQTLLARGATEEATAEFHRVLELDASNTSAQNALARLAPAAAE